jgi:hypothetical protein
LSTPADAIITLHRVRQTIKAKIEGTKRIRGMRKCEQAATIADYAVEIEALSGDRDAQTHHRGAGMIWVRDRSTLEKGGV